MNQLLLAALIGLQALQPVATGAIQGRVSSTGPKADWANFVVTVEDIEGPFPPPEQPAVMEQRELRFVPHVLVILVGTTVEFPNKDPLSHNVFSISDAKRFNFGLYSLGTIRRLKFEKPGVVELLCHVHLEMSAFIVVVKNPYFARTDADGSYRIVGVPPGRHRLRCWHVRFPAQERMVQVPEAGSVTVDFSVGK
jgi:plastocyanin